MKKCEHCGRTLVKIGNARKNGKNHKDWENRTMHKECWKRTQLYKQFLHGY